MASNEPTCDFGQFDSSRLWQNNDSNPFGSLIELACKLKRVNREFKKLYLSTYESCAKLGQSLYASDIDGSGGKYGDIMFGADFALSRAMTHQGNSDGLYLNKFGSDLKQKSRFSLEKQNNFLAANKKCKNVKNARPFRRKPSNESGDEPFYAKVSVDDLSTRKSARLENLMHDLQQKHNCPLCFYQSDNRGHLRRHLNSVHSTAKPYYCYICKKEFSRSERVKSHFMNIHPDIAYTSKIARKELYLHGDQKESVATVAAMPDDDAATAPAPMETVESVPSVRCADSESELSAQKSWERYCQISSHPFDCQKIFTCRQCTFGGGDIWLMKKHYLDVHLGATTYVCRICRYTSSCVARLVSHMLGHGELICSYCSFSTAEVKLFEKHLMECSLLTHCLLCDLEFADKIQLQEHTLTAHQLFRCKECSFSSSSSSELDAHLTVHATSNSTLIQEIESDDEMLLGPYRSRADIQDSSVLSASKRHSNVATDGCLGTAATETDTAAAVEQKWNRVEEKMLDKVLAKVNAGNVFSCPVPGCGFRASWKKSLDLHTENYHNLSSCNPNGDQTNAASSEKCTRNQNSVESLASGFFPCPFCPNSRTFKYRKSFEKHLGQHGLDHLKYPNLIARLNRKCEQVSLDPRDIQ